MDALERLLSVVPEHAAIVATTGKCGRELFTLGDRVQHLYPSMVATVVERMFRVDNPNPKPGVRRILAQERKRA